MKAEQAIRYLFDLFFPPRCLFCEEIVPPGKDICARCLAEIVPDAPFPCMNLSVSGKNIPCVALYHYAGKVRESIIRYKFSGCKQYSRYYAKMLAGRLREEVPGFSPDLVTAVPVSREREKKRGYNQSKLIASRVSAELGHDYEELLLKILDNPEQHRLNRQERRVNVKGVYLPATSVREKSVLLIDDIVTTGATLSECAEVLYGAGAARVLCAAVAFASISC